MCVWFTVLGMEVTHERNAHNFLLDLAAKRYNLPELNLNHTKTSKVQMLDVEANNPTKDSLYHKRLVELFPAVKSVKHKDLAFSVGRYDHFGYMNK